MVAKLPSLLPRHEEAARLLETMAATAHTEAQRCEDVRDYIDLLRWSHQLRHAARDLRAMKPSPTVRVERLSLARGGPFRDSLAALRQHLTEGS